MLLQRKHAAIPLTAVLNASHVATRYLKLPVVEVKKALAKMLETRSPAFYPYVSLEDAANAIEYAAYYKVMGWILN
jgi:hypothetical protein